MRIFWRHNTDIMRISAPSMNKDFRGADFPQIADQSDTFRATEGNLWTAAAHIITAVIGSGVLSLAWCMAQMGWIAGIATMFIFSFITYYTSSLLADCYRSHDPVNGKRNCTYMDAVRANLGKRQIWLCGLVQYVSLYGAAIGYTITASLSMAAIGRSNCFHKNGRAYPCHFSDENFMILFGLAEIILSQIPDFDKAWWLSLVAAIMSFSYSTDTLKSPPPENITMKKASLFGIFTTTVFYLLCGCFGYAAFGDNAPGNLLTSFGFYEPYWLIDFANACIVVHLLGAYQVYCQPVFAFVERWFSRNWPDNGFINNQYGINIPFYGLCDINFFRLGWRTAFVVSTTGLSTLFPFFNNVLGILGSMNFWPLTVYFPVEMYIVHTKIQHWTTKWILLQVLSFLCLLISLAAALGSIEGVVEGLKH